MDKRESVSRRRFMKNTARTAAASALIGTAVGHVHAAEDNTIRVALVGCGRRGAGAARDALTVKNGPIRLVAMADVFEQRLAVSHKALSGLFPDTIDVPEDRKFIGFDAYKNAMDCLRPGDVVILATPPAFRWVHFAYAIEKGLHVFMEKPVTVDGPTTRKMLALGEESVRRNLKVGVGLMCRHCEARQELHDRIKAGQIGQITMMRAYRMIPGKDFASPGAAPVGTSELLHQIQWFHGFLWASGGAYSDFLIHNIDECCWMKDTWPVEAQGSGGRHYRGEAIDQNFDNYSVEYTFGDGTKLFLFSRTITGCHKQFSSYVHGTQGAGIISSRGHTATDCGLYDGHNVKDIDPVWAYPGAAPIAYQREWNHLIDAIREDKPYNEVKRGAEASLVTSMGRMACHTGQVITYDQMLNCKHEFAPDVGKLTMDSPAPLQANTDGKYPVPMPGIIINREYA